MDEKNIQRSNCEENIDFKNYISPTHQQFLKVPGEIVTYDGLTVHQELFSYCMFP